MLYLEMTPKGIRAKEKFRSPKLDNKRLGHNFHICTGSHFFALLSTKLYNQKFLIRAQIWSCIRDAHL